MAEKRDPKAKVDEEVLRPIKKRLKEINKSNPQVMDNINEAGQSPFIKGLKAFLEWFED